MRVRKLNRHLEKYVIRKNLAQKFEKQVKYFIENPSHPSLNLEILEPITLSHYSFRIDKRYRAIFIFVSSNEIEIVDINPHYE